MRSPFNPAQQSEAVILPQYRKCWKVVVVDQIGSIGDQAAGGDEETFPVDRGQLVSGRQRDDQIAMTIAAPLAVKIRPPFGVRANSATARSISLASRN